MYRPRDAEVKWLGLVLRLFNSAVERVPGMGNSENHTYHLLQVSLQKLCLINRAAGERCVLRVWLQNRMTKELRAALPDIPDLYSLYVLSKLSLGCSWQCNSVLFPSACEPASAQVSGLTSKQEMENSTNFTCCENVKLYITLSNIMTWQN